MNQHVVSLLEPRSFAAEQYRTLRHRLEALREPRPQVVAVTGPSVADGKTTTAINLAATLAQGGEAQVLLVDADIRRPSVPAYLGLGDESKPGLVDAMLEPGRPLEDVVRGDARFAFSVLPAGRSSVPPYEAFRPARLGELVEEARRRYHYVVLDTPPVVPVPDTRRLTAWVDGFLLVVAAHKTPRKLVEESLALMEPGKVLGIVFNNDDSPLTRSYGYYGAYYAEPRPRRSWRRSPR